MHDKIGLKIGGSLVYFLYNKDKKEVYDPLFPGIPMDHYVTNCNTIIKHDNLRSIIENKINEFEIAIAKYELNKAVNDFKDYSDSF